MKIYILQGNPKFTLEQMSALKKAGKVVLIDKLKLDSLKAPFIKDSEEKIVAVSPNSVDWSFPNNVIEKIPNLKAICVPSTAFDWVDGKFLKKRGTILTNVPKYSTNSVAEYAIFMMMALARKLPLQIKSGYKQEYKDEMLLEEVTGKTMGVIGLGTIGTRIAEFGDKLGMNVVYWSKSKKKTKFKGVALDKLLSTADFIFVCLARNEGTEGFLKRNLLSKMKKTASLISNVSEKIYDHEFLIKQAEQRKIWGYSFEAEKDEKLTDFEGNIFVTPAYAWYTRQSVNNNYKIWTETILSVCYGNPKNVVN